MSSLSKSIFRLKNGLFRPRSIRFYRQLMRNQFLPQSRLNSIVETKLHDMLLFAFDHTKFYRRLYESHGLDRRDLERPGALAQLPIITKEDIRENFGDIVAHTARPEHCIKATTGGSTGVPLTVFHDKHFPEEAAWWRVSRWWGVDPSDDIAFVYRLRRMGFRALMNELMWWPTRRIFLDAAMMTEENIAAFIRSFNTLRPPILEGYVGGMYELALFVKNRNLRIHSPNAVWVTAAPVSEPQRALMQEVFNSPVYDQYGSCEVSWIACECRERKGLHLMSDIRHVEIVDDNGEGVPEGEWGRVLVTDLENRVFPLIRYEIGDRGRRLSDRCPCGVGLPLIDKIRGRISDVLKMPDGSVISGEYLTTVFDDFPDAVQAFQVRQESDYSIKLLCVLGPNLKAKKIIEDVRARLESGVSGKVTVLCQLVDNIPHDKGKTRFILSEAKQLQSSL